MGFTPHSYVESLAEDFALYWQMNPAAIIAIANKAANIIKITKQTNSFNCSYPLKLFY